ncbi:hypothetical protein [Thermoflexus sp.]|uniref:hypothetical protein n=1 Tax=Thermoflexus sp. TaxID=1969742 RepID=UPI002605EAEB|nr:hypothetical protein [Thermoflexus sp.]MCX7689407.1 hypothetical protein [Thermoflexus sp.]
MAFSVSDFQDLLELLRANPDWRQKLWELLASEELLRLPAETRALREETNQQWRQLRELIAQLAEAQRRHYEEFAAHRQETDRRFAELAEAQRRTEERVGRLEEAVAALAEAQRRHYEEFAAHRQEFLAYRAETDRRFAELAEAQRRHYEEFAAHRQEFLAYRAETDRRFAELAEALRRLSIRVEDHARDLGKLKRLHTEFRFRQRPGDFFRRLLRRAAVVPDERKSAILDDAVAAGRLREEEAEDAALLDLLVEGLHRREDRRIYLAVEISWLGSTEDVARAVRRASLFAQVLGAEVWPVVAAEDLTETARAIARRAGVWWVQDGKIFAPNEIPERSGSESSAAAREPDVH